MNAWYRAVQRAILLFGAAVMLTLVTGAVSWAVLEIAGFHVPAYTVIALVGAFVFTIALRTTREADRRVPAPTPPPRVLTKSEVEAVVILHEKGLITTEQLRAALGYLVPPPARPTQPKARR